MRLAGMISSERRERRWTQERLAQAVGVTQATVSNWERDETTPNPSEMIRLALALDLDPFDLLSRQWPEFRQIPPVRSVDRLVELRDLLADADDEQVERVTRLVRAALGDERPASDVG